jgi:hypothetical protein
MNQPAATVVAAAAATAATATAAVAAIGAVAVAIADQSTVIAPAQHVCEYCLKEPATAANANFSSRTKLFSHLESIHGVEYKGGSANKRFGKRKAIVLIGWLAPADTIDNEVWLSDQLAPPDDSCKSIQSVLFAAIYAMEHNVPISDIIDAAGKVTLDQSLVCHGVTRSSSCRDRASSLQGQEDSCNSLAETISYTPIPPPLALTSRGVLLSNTDEWVTRVNEVLDSIPFAYKVQVLDKIILPEEAIGHFHAEENCTQRLYEYCVPIKDM